MLGTNIQNIYCQIYINNIYFTSQLTNMQNRLVKAEGTHNLKENEVKKKNKNKNKKLNCTRTPVQ